MRTRKAQATEQIGTVQLEKLLDASAREGNAQPVKPIVPDDVEIIREPAPKKFPDSSGVGKPVLAVPVPVYEDDAPTKSPAVPIDDDDDDDLAIPIELAPKRARVTQAPIVETTPVEAAPVVAPAPSRRLWWLTLVVALIASGVIAARMFGL